MAPAFAVGAGGAGLLGVLRRLVCAPASTTQLRNKQTENKTKVPLVLLMGTIYHIRKTLTQSPK